MQYNMNKIHRQNPALPPSSATPKASPPFPHRKLVKPTVIIGNLQPNQKLVPRIGSQ